MKATSETGLTEDIADDGAVVPQVAVSLTVEHLAQITEAVRSSLQSQISTLVSSIVDGVVKGLQVLKKKLNNLGPNSEVLWRKLIKASNTVDVIVYAYLVYRRQPMSQWILLVVRSGGRGLGDLFTAEGEVAT